MQIDQFLDCRPVAHEDLAVCDAFAVLPETVTRERDIVDELLERRPVPIHLAIRRVLDEKTPESIYTDRSRW